MAKRRPAKVSAATPYGSPTAKKPKGNDDDDNNKGTPTPVKPSPYAKKKKELKGPPKVVIHHVVPTVSEPGAKPVKTGHEGATFIIEGYMQKKLVDCIYKKKSCPKAAQFCEDCDPVKHVFTFENKDETAFQVGDNGEAYEIKIMVFAFDGDEPLTQQDLVTLWTDTICPSLMNQRGVFPKSKPILHPETPYIRHKAWNEIIGNYDGLLNLYKFELKDEALVSFPSWLKADKANLYSMWAVGEIPKTIKEMYGLTNEHMYADDCVQEETQLESDHVAEQPVDDDKEKPDEEEDNGGGKPAAMEDNGGGKPEAVNTP